MSRSPLLHRYFARLYQRTMEKAYDEALKAAAESLVSGSGRCLDCGAGDGRQYQALRQGMLGTELHYTGLERHLETIIRAHSSGLACVQADLDEGLPFTDESFDCVCAFSVIEHLVFGCRFLREARRVLIPGGSLVIVTPNLSAWFNIALLVLGRMPSSGPHPDSAYLVGEITPIQFRETGRLDVEDPTPTDRHLVVHTLRSLRQYLTYLGFSSIRCRGFGWYPLPLLLQPLFEKLDPWHCHQLLLHCRK